MTKTMIDHSTYYITTILYYVIISLEATGRGFGWSWLGLRGGCPHGNGGPPGAG